MKKIILYSLILTWITSCTIEKRHYTDGYHVDWIGKTKKVESTSTKSNRQNQENAQLAASPAESPAILEENNPITATPAATPTLKWKNESPAVAKKAMKKEKTVKAFAGKTLAITPNYTVAPMHEGVVNSSIKEFKFLSEPEAIVMVLLCLFIPPLAVYMHEGSWTSRCTVNLILTLLCGIPGVIHAFIVCFE
jgi:uncharacterized membrane protein YqaE (UPF0057 family)